MALRPYTYRSKLGALTIFKFEDGKAPDSHVDQGETYRLEGDTCTKEDIAGAIGHILTMPFIHRAVNDEDLVTARELFEKPNPINPGGISDQEYLASGAVKRLDGKGRWF